MILSEFSHCLHSNVYASPEMAEDRQFDLHEFAFKRATNAFRLNCPDHQAQLHKCLSSDGTVQFIVSLQVRGPGEGPMTTTAEII